MGRMSLRKIHRYKTNNMNIVELIKECPKYTKLYTITHGEVLFDHVEGNCIVVITETSNGFTKYLKLDELGRLSEHGQTVLFPSTSGTWDEFDITKIEINSPFVPGQVAYNEEFCSFGFVDMNGVSLKTNEGQILPISRLATESEIDIWNQENHKKHLHYSLARKKFVYCFCPFDKVLVRQDRNKEWVADWFSSTGETFNDENRLLLEVPEYTTFKDGDVLSNKDGDFTFILSKHGEYSTSLYAYINFQGILFIGDGNMDAANKNNIERFTLATKVERQKLIDALKASKEPKAKEYLKRFFGIEEKPKYEFKPFDKVLVRDEDDKEWHISLFAREIVDDSDGLSYKYECSNGTLWDYCIHFEGNEHLLGTAENPEK